MTREALERRVRSLMERGFQESPDATEAIVVQVCGASVFSWSGLRVPQLWALHDALQGA